MKIRVRVSDRGVRVRDRGVRVRDRGVRVKVSEGYLLDVNLHFFRLPFSKHRVGIGVMPGHSHFLAFDEAAWRPTDQWE